LAKAQIFEQRSRSVNRPVDRRAQ